MTIALYPWETVETVTREQVEAEILADAEFQQWLDDVMADPADMGELEFMAYMADQLEASIVAPVLDSPRTGGWDLLPDWQRDDYVGM